MSKKELHPSIQQFKEFVKRNPRIIREVRNGNVTWQELYEEWYLLGEEDPRFDGLIEKRNNDKSKTKEEGKKEWLPQIMGALKNMDTVQLQQHANSLSQALGAIQGLLSQFQGNRTPGNSQSSKPQHPFQFRDD